MVAIGTTCTFIPFIDGHNLLHSLSVVPISWEKNNFKDLQVNISKWREKNKQAHFLNKF